MLDIEHLFGYNRCRTNVRQKGGVFAMMKRGQKIRRLRKGRCTALLVIVIMVTMLLAGGLSSATDADEGRPMQAVVVSQGDSLWCLVQKHYDYEGDIRRAIYEVRQINGLKDAIIVPGQVVYIPQR
jgi:hypothetical protein